MYSARMRLASSGAFNTVSSSGVFMGHASICAGPKSEMNFFLCSICKEQTTGLCCYARITRHHGRFGVVVSTLMDRLQDSCAYFMLAQQLTVSLGYRIIGKKWQSVPMVDYTSIGPSGCRRDNYNEPSTCQTIASTKIASIAEPVLRPVRAIPDPHLAM